jgi:hypothetical protein
MKKHDSDKPLCRSLAPTRLFSLGQVVATPGAIDFLDRHGINAATLMALRYLH